MPRGDESGMGFHIQLVSRMPLKLTAFHLCLVALKRFSVYLRYHGVLTISLRKISQRHPSHRRRRQMKFVTEKLPIGLSRHHWTSGSRDLLASVQQMQRDHRILCAGRQLSQTRPPAELEVTVGLFSRTEKWARSRHGPSRTKVFLGLKGSLLASRFMVNGRACDWLAVDLHRQHIVTRLANGRQSCNSVWQEHPERGVACQRRFQTQGDGRYNVAVRPGDNKGRFLEDRAAERPLPGSRPGIHPGFRRNAIPSNIGIQWQACTSARLTPVAPQFGGGLQSESA